jgi:hypothetical protein
LLHFYFLNIMNDRLSKPKRKSSKDHPSQEEKEAMTASLEKACLKEVRPVGQPTQLEPPPSFEPPVENLGIAAPTPTAFPDVAAAQVDYVYGDRYGGVQSTRYNSTAVDDQENDARNEYLYQQGRHICSATSSAPGYPAHFSAPFYEADAYGQGHRAFTAPSRENPSPALDRMQKILEGIGRASNASSLAIQSFVGQGEFYIWSHLIFVIVSFCQLVLS